MNWLRKFFARRVPLPPVIKRGDSHCHILILAPDYIRAYEYARLHLPYHSDWRYACYEGHLEGHNNPRIIKLVGWEAGKSQSFKDLVRRLETL